MTNWTEVFSQHNTHLEHDTGNIYHLEQLRTLKISADKIHMYIFFLGPELDENKE